MLTKINSAKLMFPHIVIITLFLSFLFPLLSRATERSELGKSLITAVETGDISKAKELISKGADVNFSPDNNFPTPLITAIALGSTSAEQLDDNNAISLFMDAVYKGDIELMRELAISVDINSDMTDNLRKTFEKHYPLIKFNKPITPLSIAVFNKDKKTISELLKLGADVNKAANMLSQAITNEVVDLFLREGIDVNVTFYMEEKKDILPLSTAIIMDKFELAKKLLNYGADPNLTDNLYITPMHYAAEKNRKYIELLIEYGGDVNAGVIGFSKPISFAANKGKLDLVKYLMSKGADIDFPGNGNIFMISLYNGDRKLAEFAVKYGAVKSGRKEFLKAALVAKNTFFVELLLQNGYELNDEYINFALVTSNADVIKLLFDKYDAELSKRHISSLVATLLCSTDDGIKIYEYFKDKKVLSLESIIDGEHTFEDLLNHVASCDCVDVSSEQMLVNRIFPSKADKIMIINRLRGNLYDNK
jgi:ankyrin repeat protein